MPEERRADVMVFIVETGKGTRAEQKKVRAAIIDLDLTAGVKRWRVEPLFPRDEDPPARLRRFLRVTGGVDAPPQHWDRVAFDIAYRLSEECGYRVYPDLPSSHYAGPDQLIPTPDPLDPDSLDSLSGGGGPRALLPFDWALKAVRAPEAWQISPTPNGGKSEGEGSEVAHPDTGYTKPTGLDPSAFDFGRDRDFLDEDDNAEDPLEQTPIIKLYNPGHGTSSASVIASKMLPNIAGVAPKAKLVPLRTIKSVVQVFDSDVARAVNYARHKGAHVISMSLGGDWFVGLEEAIEEAVKEGIIVLAAAGNYVGFVVAPAAYPSCIAVSGSNIESKPWSGACHGPKVAVCAPAEDVWAAEYFFESGQPPRIGIDQQSGTTFAVAMAAGVAALWLAHHKRDKLIATYGKARMQALFLHMVKTVGHRRPANWNTGEYGAGIIDAEALLKAALPPPSQVPDLPDTFQDATGLTPGTGLDDVAARIPERLLAIFPNLPPAEILARFERIFGIQGDALTAKLEQYQVELARLYTEHPQAWRDFVEMDPHGSELDEGTDGRPIARGIGQFGSQRLLREVQRS